MNKNKFENEFKLLNKFLKNPRFDFGINIDTRDKTVYPSEYRITCIAKELEGDKYIEIMNLKHYSNVADSYNNEIENIKSELREKIISKVKSEIQKLEISINMYKTLPALEKRFYN
jgi:hypothetical protein